MEDERQLLHLFWGNQNTVVQRTGLYNSLEREEAFDEMSRGRCGALAYYDARNPLELCERDFARYVEYRYGRPELVPR